MGYFQYPTFYSVNCCVSDNKTAALIPGATHDRRAATERSPESADEIGCATQQWQLANYLTCALYTVTNPLKYMLHTMGSVRILACCHAGSILISSPNTLVPFVVSIVDYHNELSPLPCHHPHIHA